ncbi:glyceraldehyde-3-phosphate dehydrogenase [Pseudophaeobacter sp.]|nr:glyceraldehyde-3-phosphate dehydrogenase [Pseudophaeobacter sp.]
MTNKIAIWLGLLLVLAVVADLLLFSGDNLLFLAKKLFELIDWVAFWR